MLPDDSHDSPLCKHPSDGGNRTANPWGESSPTRTAAEIQAWFVSALAKITQSAPEDIDVTIPFESFGLDSVSAVGLTGELEEWLGCSVDPMAVYDYPTIDALSQHLAEASARLGPRT